MLRQLLRNVKAGQDLDIALAVGIGIALGLLGLFGSLDQRWLLPALLLASSGALILLLQLRWGVEELRSKIATSSQPVVSKLEVTSEILDHAKSVQFIGVSLNRTLRANYSMLETLAESGAVIQILVVNPENPSAVQGVVRRSYDGTSEAHKIAEILGTIDKAKRLRKLASDSTKVDIRVLDFPIHLQLTVVNRDADDAHLLADYYDYRNPRTDPKFDLRPTDGEWYQYFLAEADSMWADAVPVDRT